VTQFATHGVLSASTGYLMGDIGDLYKVASFLLGRDAFTHELAFYGKAMSKALTDAVPGLPSESDFAHVTRDNVADILSEWERKFGASMELPDSLAGSLADGKSPVETAADIMGGGVR